MKVTKVLMAGAALAFMVGGVGSAFAQATSPNDLNPYRKKTAAHGQAARNSAENEPDTYRPLTVSHPHHPVAAAAGEVVAAPVEAAGGIAGAGLGIVGGTVTGATSLIGAPFAGLTGGPVGISPNAAPPLPIKARYTRTGSVSTTVDEGWQQPVPVDKGGPIYLLDTEAGSRSVTPFSLLAFPITGVTSVLTSPLRPAPGA